MPNSLPLTSGEIHLWLCFHDQITDASLHSAYRELLSAEEKTQERRFHLAGDRRRYLITRALARTVLSRYATVQPQDWVFTTNAHRRPEISNAEGKDAGLAFNISHAGGLIVLGVTAQRALGVDVENWRERKASLDVAGRFFSPQEVAALAATPSPDQPYRFFEYWTFKEAYIKARGMGLALPLGKFSFHYPDERGVEINIDPELADDARRWQFWQLRPADDYLVAVCAERIGAQSPSLVVRQAIPLQSETLVAHKCLRASDPRSNTAP